MAFFVPRRDLLAMFSERDCTVVDYTFTRIGRRRRRRTTAKNIIKSNVSNLNFTSLLVFASTSPIRLRLASLRRDHKTLSCMTQTRGGERFIYHSSDETSSPDSHNNGSFERSNPRDIATRLKNCARCLKNEISRRAVFFCVLLSIPKRATLVINLKFISVSSSVKQQKLLRH
jgi:hypothetical protein